MDNSNRQKKTVAKKMIYLGGAIWEGQDIKGVELTPDIFREASIFSVLRDKYQVESIDLGNISAKDY